MSAGGLFGDIVDFLKEHKGVIGKTATAVAGDLLDNEGAKKQLDLWRLQAANEKAIAQRRQRVQELGKALGIPDNITGALPGDIDYSLLTPQSLSTRAGVFQGPAFGGTPTLVPGTAPPPSQGKFAAVPKSGEVFNTATGDVRTIGAPRGGGDEESLAKIKAHVLSKYKAGKPLTPFETQILISMKIDPNATAQPSSAPAMTPTAPPPSQGNWWQNTMPTWLGGSPTPEANQPAPKLTPDKAREFLAAANGNKAKARDLARKAGYVF